MASAWGIPTTPMIMASARVYTIPTTTLTLTWMWIFQTGQGLRVE